MDESALDKFATMHLELIEYAESLEKENKELREMNKKASAVVSDAVADETCNALEAAGFISKTQLGQVKQAYLTDPAAAHRTILGIIDAYAQTKTASAESQSLDGGSLVGVNRNEPKNNDCLDRMSIILGLNY